MAQVRDLNHFAKQQPDPLYADAVLVMRNCAIPAALPSAPRILQQHSKEDCRQPQGYGLSVHLADVCDLGDGSGRDRQNSQKACSPIYEAYSLDNNWDLAHMEWNASQIFDDFISKLSPTQQLWFRDATDLINQRKPTAAVVLGADSNSTASGGTPVMIFPLFQ